MTTLTINIEPDELLGLNALAEMDRMSGGGEAETARTASALLHNGIATKLDQLGLPWAPTPEAVTQRVQQVATPPKSTHMQSLRTAMKNERVKRYALSVVAVAALVVLEGGYVQKWKWTGFPANEQLWDWFNLLLLPVVVGTIPIWLQHGEQISRTRRLTYGVLVIAFVGFVTAGYLLPINWTGFSGNTLWNWLVLLMLPVALVTVRIWPISGRELRAHHKALIGLIAAGWIVSLIGGYGWTWSWTGYQGNTLWDWLQLLLLPLVLPTILLPAALKWISGNAEQRAKDASALAHVR